MMKRPLSTLVFFFISIAILVIHGFASDIPMPNTPRVKNKQSGGHCFHGATHNSQFPDAHGPYRPTNSHPSSGQNPVTVGPYHPYRPTISRHSLGVMQVSLKASPNKCWSALQEIEGCVHDIASSFLAGKFNVGLSCCKTFTDIKNDCSVDGSGVFNVPFFHQALQQHCSSQVAPPSKS